jgi:acetylornithine deacetylase/succinyl-diaminopimelate desuccinylase-like protein
MVRDTVVLTVLQGGSKANVIPSESSATFDCRLIPGTSKEEFLEEIKRRSGEGVAIKALAESQSILPSPLDTDLYKAIQKSASQNDPGCPAVPLLLPGATDSRFLRDKGIIAYDFCPYRLTEKDLLRVHGNNERVALENLRFGMKMMVDVIKEIAT